jgi:hypothetical protein
MLGEIAALRVEFFQKRTVLPIAPANNSAICLGRTFVKSLI